MQRSTRLAIIGAGRLGTALALALSKRNYTVGTIVSRTRKSAIKAARLVGGPSNALGIEHLDSMSVPDLVIITTPDDQIRVVADLLASLDLPKRQSPVVLHTSGALSSEVLSPLSTMGWHVGSVHPLLSVSNSRGVADFAGVYWSVEGQAPALRMAKRLVRDLGGRSFSVVSERKALYHAAAVMTAGNVVALFDVALEMLKGCGLSTAQAKEVLFPLLTSTVKNLAAKDTSAALTGPFARGDVDTIERHIRALADVNDQDTEELYRILGRRSLKLASGTKLDRKTTRKIKRVLK